MAGSRNDDGVGAALPQAEGIPGDVQGEIGRRGELAEPVPLGGGLGRVEAFLDDLPLCFEVEHGQIPNWSKSLIRCSHIQSIPSAASYPR